MKPRAFLPFTILLLGGLLCPSSLFAQTSVDEVFDFLQKNVINRTVTVKGEGKIADGRVAYEFQRDMTFCNLVRSGDELSFDLISNIKQRNQDLDESGQKTGEPHIKDRILVLRYEMGRKKSTGAMLGFNRLMTTTMGTWRGYAGEIRVEMKEGAMLMTTKTVGYDDYYDKGDTYFPGSSEMVEKYHLVDDELVITTTSSKTLRLAPQADKVAEVKMDALPGDSLQTAKLPLD